MCDEGVLALQRQYLSQGSTFPQVGHLMIEDEVEIGAGSSTVDRGALDATLIEAGAKLDSRVHVAHNVRIGRNVVIAAQTGIAGSSVVEESVMYVIREVVHCRPGKAR
jgi:UDP-3-O-[3-hydroxymyristoyl] glucosamine N-acyltransferase